MSNIGYGAMLQRETDVADTFEDVGEVIELSPPGLSADTYEKTHMNSPGRVKQYGKALIETGEASVTVQAEPGALAMSKMIRDVADVAEPVRKYRIAFGDDTTVWTFEAIATGFEPATPLADRQTAVFTLKVSGQSDFVTAAVAAANA